MQALRIRPDHADSHRILAEMLHVHMGRFDQARDQYEACLALNEGDAIAHQGYGRLLCNHFRDLDSAFVHLHRAFVLDEANCSDAKALIERGACPVRALSGLIEHAYRLLLIQY